MAAVIDPRTTNSLWASVLVGTLHAAGVRHAVISPGSRSTPLTLAFAAHPEIEAIPVLDERSAGFFALGLAKRDLRPVVLLCTSGTAAANYFPAVIEAAESGVPLVVLTADRPPELRACASGQTIDQQKLFGSYVGFYHELAVPESEGSRLRYLRQTVAHAVERTLRPGPGPVHLNVPFRDPLPPLGEDSAASALAAATDWNAFFAHLRPVEGALDPTGRPPQLDARRRGVIVVGPEQRPNQEEFLDVLAAVARKLGWPVLTDGLTPVRSAGDWVPRVVTTADTLLRDPKIAEQLRPEVVLAVGGWPTSKVLRGWLETSEPEIHLQTTRVDNRDPLHGRTAVFASLPALAQVLPEGVNADGEYVAAWLAAERRVRTALDQRLAATPDLFEGKAAWLLARHLPRGTPVVIANSMPVRDVEYFWPATDRRIRPLCNRGANGIDGTLSTALGVAHRGQPTVLLTGDLALLHDTNGFLLHRELVGSLTIVLINNAGGGIFEHLPIAQFDPPFERFFATPQQVNFAGLAAAYGVAHVPVTNWEQFVALIETLPERGIRVLELRTDRKRDAATRKRWFQECAGRNAAG